MKLSFIALSGFQTFDSLVRIPVSRITMLFGPNSAGKSAVRDAVDAFWRVIGNKDGTALFNLSDGGAKIFEALRTDWRRTGPGDTDYANALSIILGFNGTFRSQADGADIVDPVLLLVLILGWHNDKPIVSFQFQITTQKSFEDLSGTLQERLKNSVFVRTPDLVSVKETYVWNPSRNTDFAQVTAIPGVSDGYSMEISPNIALQSGVDDWLWPLSTLRQASLSEYTDYVSVFSQFVHESNLVLRALLNELRIASHQVFVPASRTVPSATDLKFQIAPSRRKQSAISIETYGLPEYKSLSVACFALANDAKPDIALCPPRDLSRAKAVNRQLSESLFSERGYRLDVGYALLVSQNDDGTPAGRATRPRVLPDRNNGVILQLQLADAEGRRFQFTDVGSGLGYVLPVLLAANAPSGVAFIQQPELHLHPALQSSLADAFIEASSQSDDDSTAQLIIETHSEHIILRMLRRIRQTTNGTLPSPELALTPSEISVVYFDPKPDGTTEVKALAVTADGDFADRWPRGFFNERDVDLFDE